MAANWEIRAASWQMTATLEASFSKKKKKKRFIRRKEGLRKGEVFKIFSI